MSIEETNKLRAKLGLKPLLVDDKKPQTASTDPNKAPNTYVDKETAEEFEHKPALNIAEVREQKEFKRKLEEQREKRRLLEKLEKMRKDAGEKEDGEEEETAEQWIAKLKEKEEAKKKAKMLEEMDKQFEEEAEESVVKNNKTTKGYTQTHLKGFKVWCYF